MRPKGLPAVLRLSFSRIRSASYRPESSANMEAEGRNHRGVSPILGGFKKVRHRVGREDTRPLAKGISDNGPGKSDDIS